MTMGALPIVVLFAIIIIVLVIVNMRTVILTTRSMITLG
jgi:hypothetical protein